VEGHDPGSILCVTVLTAFNFFSATDLMNFIQFQSINKLLFALAIGLAFLIISPTISEASALTKAPNNLGLVGYWNFEDGKLSKATDFSGNGNVGTLTNMEEADWVVGKKGKALSFDGVNESVNAGTASSLQTTGNLSIGAWIKLTSQPALDTNAYQIVAKDKDSGGRAYAFDYYNLTGNRHLRFYINGGAGSNKLEGTTALATGVWYYVAATYSTGGVITLYINGAQEAQGSGAATSIPSASANVTIGAREYTGFEDYFNGSIDDVRIYNRTLSAAEVASLYAQSSQSLIKNSSLGLVAHWTFEEGTGTATADKTGNGNTGTLTNGPTWAGGKFGKGISFDGTDDYVAVPNLGFSGAARQFSVCMWYNPSTGSTLRTLFSMGGDGTNSSANSLEILRDYPSANDLSMYGNGQAVRLTANSTPAVNQWTHACFSSDGTTTKIYTNGTQAASTAFSWTINNNTYAIGADLAQGGVAYNWYGSIDDVRIYNRALSAQEVSNLYNSSGEALGILNRAHRDTLTSGLVGYWSFDGSQMSGNTATDGSGGGNFGTLTSGPTKTIGVLGQGVKFDGSDDYVTMGDAVALNGVQSRTISTWVKFSSDPLTTAQWLVERGNATNATYWLWWNGDNSFSLGDNTLVCGHRIANGTGEQIANTWTPVANMWYHVSCVYDGSQLIEYVNGVLLGSAGSATGSVTDETSSARTLQLGRRIATGGSNLNGILDDARLYNRALSASEILQLYNMGK
jgi:hypothetical protein